MMNSQIKKSTDQALAQRKTSQSGQPPLYGEDLFEQLAKHEAPQTDQRSAMLRAKSIYQKKIPSCKALKTLTKTACKYGCQSPIPWTGTEPSFQIARNSGFFGFDEIRPSELVHVLSIGGTGTGKTCSNVAPLLSAQLRYVLPCDAEMKRSSILVIDPKHELLATVESVLAAQDESSRLIMLGNAEQPRPVKFFTQDESLTMREKLTKMGVVLGTNQLAEGIHGYWQTAAMHVVEQFMNLEDSYRVLTSESLTGRLVTKNSLTVRAKNFWGCLEAVFRRSRCGRRAFKSINADLKDLLKAAELSFHSDSGVMDAFEEEAELMQWQYRMQSADPIIGILADSEVVKVLDMDPFDAPDSDSLDLRDALERGHVVVFQPSKNPNSVLAACAIKTKWQEGVSCRDDMVRPVGLVVDEFQKFITLDDVSGDATFLDTARGYRCNAVYATQSIEALEHALKSTPHARTAVAAIVANTPSKWFFATKDKQTETTMMSLIPASPAIGTPHILTTRPAAQLKSGEAYWSLADGRWGRGRADLKNLL